MDNEETSEILVEEWDKDEWFKIAKTRFNQIVLNQVKIESGYLYFAFLSNDNINYFTSKEPIEPFTYELKQTTKCKCWIKKSKNMKMMTMREFIEFVNNLKGEK